MTVNRPSRFWMWSGAAAGIGLIVAFATCIGSYAGYRIATESSKTEWSDSLAELQLQAATASSGKTMSMATGQLDKDVEALFVLDHISGNLQCWLLNSRTGGVGGIYRINVIDDLVLDKAAQPEFLMVTGRFFWSAGFAANVAPALSVVYIADGNSGNVVGYSVTVDKQAVRRGLPQAGLLKLVCKGSARDIITRDQ